MQIRLKNKFGTYFLSMKQMERSEIKSELGSTFTNKQLFEPLQLLKHRKSFIGLIFKPKTTNAMTCNRNLKPKLSQIISFQPENCENRTLTLLVLCFFSEQVPI